MSRDSRSLAAICDVVSPRRRMPYSGELAGAWPTGLFAFGVVSGSGLCCMSSRYSSHADRVVEKLRKQIRLAAMLSFPGSWAVMQVAVAGSAQWDCQVGAWFGRHTAETGADDMMRSVSSLTTPTTLLSFNPASPFAVFDARQFWS